MLSGNLGFDKANPAEGKGGKDFKALVGMLFDVVDEGCKLGMKEGQISGRGGRNLEPGCDNIIKGIFCWERRNRRVKIGR